MATIMQGFAIVMRTLFIAVAILTTTGVFPAMASLGSCAMKPCCAHEKAIAAIAHPACCNETSGSMTPAKPFGLTERTSVRERPIVAASATDVPIPALAHDHLRQRAASRSLTRHPETISILLI
ncbi:MAG TPA: hypothetical protein VN380_01355 [Thermoanaerobaculia bacterium]|nr:hypothetical protein [Thermoanaerobaculia bacterium]